MTWKENTWFDDETLRLLKIAQHFLTQYFGHSAPEAEQLVHAFIQSGVWDEDTMHHESSFRVAAAAHYLCALQGDRSKLGSWFLAEGHNNPPPEAMWYFREHYFRKQ